MAPFKNLIIILMGRKICFYLLTSVLLHALIVRAEPISPLNEDSQRIMEFKLKNGMTLDDSFVIYPFEGSWLVPLQQFAENLGIFIKASPQLGIAEGFILKENRIFKLDLNKCTYTYIGTSQNFDCHRALIYQNEIYIRVEEASSWFPVQIDVDALKSTIWITTKEKFPIEASVERERGKSISKIFNIDSDPGYPRVENKYKWFDGFVLDQQLQFTSHHTESIGREDSFTHDSALSMEVLKLETHGFASGDAKQITAARINLGRKDIDGGLLGPIHAKDFQLANIDFPPLSFISQGSLGLGAKVSNFPLYQPSQIGFQDFMGDLPEGWEVELYQNETLIDRQKSSAKKRYEFKNVPLAFGVNRFRLAFYGPQGQVRNQYETYGVDNSLSKPGETFYRSSYGKLDNQTEKTTLEMQHGVFKWLSTRGGYAHLTPGKLDKDYHYGLIGFNAYFDSLLVSETSILSSSNGWAQDVAVQFPIRGITLGANHTMLKSFKSDFFNSGVSDLEQDRQSKFNFSLLLPFAQTVRATFEAVENHYLSGSTQDNFVNRLSTNIGPFFFNNELIFDNTSAPLTGLFTTIFLAGSTQFKSILGYEKQGAQSIVADIQTRFGTKTLIKFGAARRFAETVNNYVISFVRYFDQFSISTQVNSNFKTEFSASAILSYSLFQGDHEIFANGRAQSNHGVLRVHVFYDKNDNGIFDEDDEPIPNIAFTVNRQDVERRSDSSGHVNLTELAPYQPADISVTLRSIENADFRPRQKGYRVFPRPGKLDILQFPIIFAKDVDGQILISQTSRPINMRSLIVELADSNGNILATTKPEKDGFFLFTGVKPGEYQVRISPNQLHSEGMKAEPRTYNIEFSSIKEVDQIIEFRLSK